MPRPAPRPGSNRNSFATDLKPAADNTTGQPEPLPPPTLPHHATSSRRTLRTTQASRTRLSPLKRTKRQSDSGSHARTEVRFFPERLRTVSLHVSKATHHHNTGYPQIPDGTVVKDVGNLKVRRYIAHKADRKIPVNPPSPHERYYVYSSRHSHGNYHKAKTASNNILPLEFNLAINRTTAIHIRRGRANALDTNLFENDIMGEIGVISSNDSLQFLP